MQFEQEREKDFKMIILFFKHFVNILFFLTYVIIGMVDPDFYVIERKYSKIIKK